MQSSGVELLIGVDIMPRRNRGYLSLINKNRCLERSIFGDDCSSTNQQVRHFDHIECTACNRTYTLLFMSARIRVSENRKQNLFAWKLSLRLIHYVINRT